MDNQDLRRDPLTGVLSFHPDQRNKPFPITRRTLPELRSPCVFCALATAPVNDCGEILNGEQWTPLKHDNAFTFTIENRWRPFGPTSGADLVIARRHATSVEELTPSEAEEFFEALLEIKTRHQRNFCRTLAYINVGLEVNGTQAHLHGQIVSTNLDTVAPIVTNLTSLSLRDDEELARRHDLVVNVTTGALTYCAWAPTTTGETRVVADDPTALARGVQDTLSRMNRAYGELSYNVVLLVGPSLVAQVLPRFTAVGVLPPYFGLAVIMIAPEDVAAALRRDTTREF